MTRELVTGLRLVVDCFILVVNDPPAVRARPEDAKDGDGRPGKDGKDGDGRPKRRGEAGEIHANIHAGADAGVVVVVVLVLVLVLLEV
jgi:hypothetical protein